MSKLEENEVLKVLNLAKLDKDSENVELLRSQLGVILEEIEKIEKLDIDEEIVISPSDNKNVLFKDEPTESVSKEAVFKNAKTHDETYIEVVGVLHE